MLVFLATQINNAKRLIAEASLEKNKNSINLNSSSAFFLAYDNMTQCNIEGLMTPFAHRVVTLHPPNLEKVCQIVTESRGKPVELATRVAKVCSTMKECFELTYCQIFERDFVTSVLEKTIEMIPSYNWLKGMKCKE